MRFWFDTEFIEDGRTIDLISIGIVSEDGREYYAVSREFNPKKAGDWVRDNVLSKLGDVPRKKRREIRDEVRQFLGSHPEVWGYYCDYDWVVLCQLFGRMVDLPEDWPKFCLDIKQLCIQKGDPVLPNQDEGEHNALSDARWNMIAWDFLMGAEANYNQRLDVALQRPLNLSAYPWQTL